MTVVAPASIFAFIELFTSTIAILPPVQQVYAACRKSINWVMDH